MFTISRYVPGSFVSQNSGDEKDQGSSGPSRVYGSSALNHADEPSEVESGIIPSKDNRKYSNTELGELKPRRQPGTDKKRKGMKNKKKSINLSPSTLTTGIDSSLSGAASRTLKSRVSGSSHEVKEKRSRKRSRGDSCERRGSVASGGVDKMVEPSLLVVPCAVDMSIVTDSNMHVAPGSDVTTCEEEKRMEHIPCALPAKDEAVEWGLDPLLVEHLQSVNVQHFFPIQRRALPRMLVSRKNDVCISAPTGSGKTLVYVLAVLQNLLSRRIRRLRALVLLPNRDLAVQVHSVFKHFCATTDLRVGLSVGGRSSLLEDTLHLCGLGAVASVDPGGAARHSRRRGHPHYGDQTYTSLGPGGHSEVDILVATPGRLQDHLCRPTPGFTLQHLRYLIVDEADKLLQQGFGGWVRRVRDAARPLPIKGLDTTSVVPWPIDTTKQGVSCSSDEAFVVEDAANTSPHPPESLVLGQVALDNYMPQFQRWDESFNRLQILLCSATLANDPEMLASLGLLNPTFYTAAEDIKSRSSNQQSEVLRNVCHTAPLQSTAQVMAEFSGTQESSLSSLTLPALLEEDVMMCSSSDKPLVLLRELRKHHESSENMKLALVFASSVDTVHRCTRLLQLAGIGVGKSGKVAELSRGLSTKSRRRLISAANQDVLTPVPKKGKIDVIVCSDAMARGMDIASVDLVVNYDAPQRLETYVHRVGRTARAGRGGRALTILKQGQQASFKTIRAGIVGGSTAAVKVVKAQKPSDNERVELQRYLEGLKEALERENNGELSHEELLPPLS